MTSQLLNPKPLTNEFPLFCQTYCANDTEWHIQSLSTVFECMMQTFNRKQMQQQAGAELSKAQPKLGLGRIKALAISRKIAAVVAAKH